MYCEAQQLQSPLFIKASGRTHLCALETLQLCSSSLCSVTQLTVCGNMFMMCTEMCVL